MSPTERTLRLLRREGFTAAVVEKWISQTGVRKDLWNFADILAVNPQKHIFLLVQTTTLSNIASRLKKSKACPELAIWLEAGGMFEIYGWAKKQSSWQVKRIIVRSEDLKDESVCHEDK